MRISDWSSDVCSSDLAAGRAGTALVAAVDVPTVEDGLHLVAGQRLELEQRLGHPVQVVHVLGEHLARLFLRFLDDAADLLVDQRSEEHTSELQSLMRISYAVFCLKKKKNA